MPPPLPDRPMTDAEILALLEQRIHAAAQLQRLHDGIDDDDDADEREDAGPSGDACPHCGEPALALSACEVCSEDGCLPRDDWQPGWADPCLTRCARCGREVHVDCAGVDEAGNRVCCGPRRAADDAD